MPTPTYTLIDSTTLSSSASSVTFSGISGTGKGDLVLSAEVKASSGTINLSMRLNSDTGSNYNHVLMYGNGSSAASFASSNRANIQIAIGSGTATNAITTQTFISDYSATDKHKSTISRGNEPSYTSAGAGRWANTSAVTSLEVYTTTTDSYAAGSTFNLYQIVSE
tara:strand:+ start:80 stop:577 length:498 start_codon:yes stop_codon:yes gene_type:complete